METLQMQDNFSRNCIYEPCIKSCLATDDIVNFNADTGILDVSFIELSANPEKTIDASLPSYLNPEYAFNTNLYSFNYTCIINNSFPDLETLPGYQAREIPVAGALGTCQLSSISPAFSSISQSTSLSLLPSTATSRDLENHLRWHSECPSLSTSSSASSSRSTTSSEDEPRSNISASNRASQTDTKNPRKKRGRKRANISDEERRNRKLERGRIAANKCRQKKRVREHDLKSKSLQLLIERDQMLKLNHELRDEIMGLQSQIMRHVGGECGGIPNVNQIMSSVILPPERLDEVDRSKGDRLKNLLGNSAFRSGNVAVDAGMSQSQ